LLLVLKKYNMLGPAKKTLLAPSSKVNGLSATWQINIKLSVILDLPDLACHGDAWRMCSFFYSFGATVTTAA